MLTKEQIAAAVETVASKYGIEKVWLYGSYACGDATEESDCDLLIQGGRLRTMLDLSALFLDMKAAIGKPVDIVNMKGIQPSFHRRIETEEVLLYGAQ
ncbi:MAG: nucleotidyltransferase domain-containing protein [Oscillospiraceae bacterium]|jgi:predicted nucleotidyltransferase|nr:nucleotidyltransferase domain-containing protein [Oscillospiraceae bacterium]